MCVFRGRSMCTEVPLLCGRNAYQCRWNPCVCKCCEVFVCMYGAHHFVCTYLFVMVGAPAGAEWCSIVVCGFRGEVGVFVLERERVS